MMTAIQLLQQALENIKAETVGLQYRIHNAELCLYEDKKTIETYLNQVTEIEVAIKLLEKKNGRKNQEAT